MAAPMKDTRIFNQALAEIAAAIGSGGIRHGEAIAQLDPGGHPDNLRASAVVSPASTQEVAAVIGICRRNSIAIVPQGGRTGLVGGGISKRGELVLSLQKMNRIVEIDPIECVAVVEAGATLQALQEAAMEHRLEPGIDLAARGSATLGGMVSTNAGGVMAFRNGVMRHRILGLEAVLTDGSVYSDLTRVVKNSAGYDLKHLFIGAEGTLGVVTKLVIKLDPVPRATATAIFGLPSTRAALDLVALARATGKLRAAEVLWSRYFKFTSGHFGWAAPDYDGDSPAHLVIGLGGNDETELHDALMALFETIAEPYPETTAVLAASTSQEQEIWRLREETGLMYRDYPAAPSYDISVPLGQTEAFLDRAVPALSTIEAGLSPFVFGHLADGNLHIVLNRPGDWLTDERRDAIEAILYADLRAMGGSFSAEHGVGSKRIHALRATSDPTKLVLMAQIKKALDPANLFNPGKLFDRS
ncbi:FAD-binding oxidoreductase [Rhizobium herbae]|uniref:FAD/FMN-containing dehydrogenase n=1 Tax=Rhizobium herbae TaxID=508661 RepID=A0ABS4ERD3_9HYPH|nr:FAD-binding oxidoreductase [Rhizobium herbae]MBP1860515.1 FAD/FMN-containing dehydrogenase [Rhizobium herbae]